VVYSRVRKTGCRASSMLPSPKYCHPRDLGLVKSSGAPNARSKIFEEAWLLLTMIVLLFMAVFSRRFGRGGRIQDDRFFQDLDRLGDGIPASSPVLDACGGSFLFKPRRGGGLLAALAKGRVWTVCWRAGRHLLKSERSGFRHRAGAAFCAGVHGYGQELSGQTCGSAACWSCC